MDLTVRFDGFKSYCEAYEWCYKRWHPRYKIWYAWNQAYGITFSTIEYKMEFIMLYA